MATTKQMAVLFADVSGSTRLYESIGDAEAFKHIEACLEVLKSIATEHSGRVVKTIGDELMCVFPDAEACGVAACEMQASLAERPAVAGVKLAIRVGFHAGPLLEEADGDVFGDTVNVAARLVGLAKAGQIITAHETVETLSAPLRTSSRSLDSLAVKGKQSEINVCELLWQESDELTLHAARRTPVQPVRLRLVHNSRELVLDENRGTASFGRDRSNDLVIVDRMASRQHAKIERRRDKFVLADQSTNGTFVKVSGEHEMVLKREEFILQRSGSIAFGRSVAAPGAERVDFFVE